MKPTQTNNMAVIEEQVPPHHEQRDEDCIQCAGGASIDAGERPQTRRSSRRRSDRRASAGASLKVGEVAPDFTLPCIEGSNDPRKLSDFRGRKVMLCFYRHPDCPVCAYTVNNLIGNYRKLAWASKLEVITMFAASLDAVRAGVTRNFQGPVQSKDHGFRKTVANGALMNDRDFQYPFHALADPGGDVFTLFQVGKRSIFGSVKDALPFKHALPILRTAAHGDKSVLILPSEFLIDEKGVIVDIFRAKRLSDSIPMDRVNCFLLYGNPCPENEANTKKQKSKRGDGKLSNSLYM